eukprot:TRINITY_DN2477_c0_g1_i1.p2 TRINITY_DN2477_c0_g1~~TRINITY_DN2477_c0_g1_i1.p2  ORF type:complete len:512 (-),score=119.70 TRINITY_DN2477_c0_g1_i1:1735-3270(-)
MRINNELCWKVLDGHAQKQLLPTATRRDYHSSVSPQANLKLGLTFDDVLLVPRYSAITSRKDVHLKTRLTKGLGILTPIVSSNMDTVTEEKMAIAMARNGGVGVIHRYLSIEEQTAMVRKVKRAESLKVEEPYTCLKTVTIEELNRIMNLYSVKSILVTDVHNHLEGIITRRDMRFATPEMKVEQLMTPRDKLITSSPTSTIHEAKELLEKHKLEKLPLVNSNNHLCGLITSKDIINHLLRPNASLDPKGRLLVGAAIGVKEGFLERAVSLIEAGVDFLVIDIAHGHSLMAIRTVEEIKKHYPEVEVVAGNVCTAAGTRDLINAGADAIKVGVGPGSICTTRIVTGCGVPQLTAIMACSEAAASYHIPIIADGGIRTSGDIVKALAAGANTVMLGSMLAGSDESPGQAILKDGKRVKIVRGMAGYGANMSDRQKRLMKDDIFDIVPEGVEGTVPYRGPVEGILSQLVGGISSGLSYCGATTIGELQANAEMIRITGAGKAESSHHDVDILK